MTSITVLNNLFDDDLTNWSSSDASTVDSGLPATIDMSPENRNNNIGTAAVLNLSNSFISQSNIFIKPTNRVYVSFYSCINVDSTSVMNVLLNGDTIGTVSDTVVPVNTNGTNLRWYYFEAVTNVNSNTLKFAITSQAPGTTRYVTNVAIEYNFIRNADFNDTTEPPYQQNGY